MRKLLLLITAVICTTALPAQHAPHFLQKSPLAHLSSANMPSASALSKGSFFKQSALVTKQRLDSNTNQLFQGTWNDEYKTIYSYDVQQRVTEITNYSYKTTPIGWVPEDKESFVYNVAGYTESKTSYDWDKNLSQWVGNSRDVWVYDLSGKILIQTSLFWDVPTSNWVPTAKGEYSYNANNLVSDIIWSHYDADSSAWYIGSKEERTYNGSNQLTLALFSWWDDQASVFQPGSKDEYTWHTNGKISIKLSSMYDSWMMTWSPEFKEEYTYDSNGNKTLAIYSEYDWGSQQMLPSQKEEQTFNSLNNLMEEIISYYNLSATSWELNTKTTFVYNDTYALNDLILPFTSDYMDIPETFNHMLTSYNQFNYNQTTQAWEDIYRGTMHYSPQVISGIEETSKVPARLYPNPASNLFSVETSGDVTLSITDLKGAAVYNNLLKGAGIHTIETRLLPGIYLYTLTRGDQVPVTGKLMIQ
ncbi:MAG TPA: T9SS type A sorting domain-containing protein [Bacteroidales bacterium]|nr:T9SS type A sorting domain-containing protein [Bacteroidales bacterium]HRZ50202.1 T9SS type A sorting domain-containing protein [Bacteroidales bacterium]